MKKLVLALAALSTLGTAAFADSTLRISNNSISSVQLERLNGYVSPAWTYINPGETTRVILIPDGQSIKVYDSNRQLAAHIYGTDNSHVDYHQHWYSNNLVDVDPWLKANPGKDEDDKYNPLTRNGQTSQYNPF